MNRRGFTLAELVVSTFILAIIGVVVADVYIAAGRFAAAEQDRIVVDLSANRILRNMNETLRQASDILPSATINGTTYTTGTTTLVASLPSIVIGSLSPTYTDTVVYEVQGADLVQILQPDSHSSRTAQTATITGSVGDCYFRYDAATPSSANSVDVLLRTRKTIISQSYVQTALLHVTLRNHNP